MDIDSHLITKNGTPIELTAKEFDLLVMLMKNKGRVLTRNTLLDKVWGMEYFGDTRTVDVHVRICGRRLRITQNLPLWYRRVEVVGYKFAG